MGRRRKNTFSKALGHLKSTTIDEKLQMLSERPTNSVMTYMTTVANTVNPDFVSSERGQENALGVIEPDFSVGEDPTTSEEAKDTSGLFKEDGTIRVAQPPITEASPDRSYILGPMAAMYYTWSYPWTMIGYIRQSDRKFVNLARIDGKLSDWDGSSNFNNSYWGSQLTLEQAVWFRDVQKNPGATNDPDTYNYRAFYPGPPSNTPDAFGRYYCITTGEPIDPKLPGVGEPPNEEGESGEPTPGDIFSAIMDRVAKGKKLSKAEEQFLRDHGMGTFVDELSGGNIAYGAITDLIGLGLTFAAVKALIPLVTAGGAKALQYAKGLGKWWNKGRNVNIANENNASWWRLVKDDFKQVGKFSGGKGKWYPRNFAELKQAFNRDGGIIWSFTKGIGTGPTPLVRQAFERLVKLLALERMTTEPVQGEPGDARALPYKGPGDARALPYKGPGGGERDSDNNYSIQPYKGPGKSVGSLPGSKGPGDVKALPYKGPGKSVGSLPGSKGPEGDKMYAGGTPDFDERTGKYKPGKGPKRGGSKKSVGSLPGSKGPKGGKVYAGGSKDFDERTGKYRSGKGTKKGGSKNKGGKVYAGGPGWDPRGGKHYATASYHLQGSTLSESRKTEILKNLKKPVVLPETKQKSYKVKPKLRGIISKPHIAKASAPAEYKPPENLWGKEEYNHNVKRSQEKMNAVYELLGDGSMALEHMLTDSNKMNAAQLDKFWGLHPELYSYFYNGKKYKAIRKEQLKGDYLVFLIDENGVKSNILQSDLNEKLAEEQEMKELEEYNKMNPKNEPISFEKDYMFKKAYQKLKKEIDYPKKPAKKGYPDEPPPKMVNGYHPEFGKRYKYDKLDPHSAEAMPNQDNPEIDANIEKAKKQPKIQPGKKPKVIPIETKTEQLQLSNWRKDLEK